MEPDILFFFDKHPGALPLYQTWERRILAEVEHVNRVCYDMSPKPPATIEFE